MVMWLGGVGGCVGVLRHWSGDQLRRPTSKPHRSSFVANLFLFFQQTDHRITGCFIEFRAVGFFQATDVSGELNGGHLHSQAKAEVEYAMFARVAAGRNLSFRAATGDSAQTDDAGS